MARTKKTQQCSADTKSEIKKKKESAEKNPKQLSPFDIIGMMFKASGEFENLSNFALERNFFMINRTCAIAYPLQAQWFNKTGISGSDTIKAWRTFLIRQHGIGRTPSFVYTKGSKATSDKEHNISILKDIDKDDIKAYCEHYHLSNRDFKDLEEFNPQQLLNHIQQYINIIKATNCITKSKTSSKK